MFRALVGTALVAASIHVPPCSDLALAKDEVPQRLEDYSPDAFVQNGALDRLRKRSVKRRWNEIRRDDRAARRDRDETEPGKLEGNPRQPVPEPQVETEIPEVTAPDDISPPNDNPSPRDERIGEFAEPSLAPRAESPRAETPETRLAPPARSNTVRLPVSSRSQIREEIAQDPAESPLPSREPSLDDVPIPEPTPGFSPETDRDDSLYSEPARNPDELKSITAISPFRTYEPDRILAADDPCTNLCPRPDGMPCDPVPGKIVPECPEEFSLGDKLFTGRIFDPSCYSWEPSNVYYNPLYFEDPKLERYGHTYHDVIQPFASVGRFGVQLVGLPYQMVIDEPCRRVYPLGYYRPGDCAPKRIKQIPWNLRAALFQAEVVAGAFFLFP